MHNNFNGLQGMPKTEEMILQALQNLDSKIDKLDSRVDGIDRTLVKTQANLGEHMRRTQLAEENIQLARQESKKDISDLREEVKPAVRHAVYMEGALKFIGLLATVASIVAVVMQFI